MVCDNVPYRRLHWEWCGTAIIDRCWPLLTVIDRCWPLLTVIGQARLHWEWCGAPEHLPAILKATKRHPDVHFVLDHLCLEVTRDPLYDRYTTAI